MSVSGGDAGVTGSGDINVALAMAGDKGFTQRLAELNAAQEAYEKALADLNLGKSAIAAQTEAGRILSAAKDKSEADEAAFNVEMLRVRESVNSWAEKTKSDILASLSEANANLAEAKFRRETAEAAATAAQNANADAQSQAAVLVQAAQAQCRDLIAAAEAKASGILSDADKIKQAAKDALVEASALKAKYDKAIAGIQAAMV